MKEQREVAANERQDELVEYQKNNRDLSKEVELLKQSSQDSKVGHVIGNQGYKCCCIMWSIFYVVKHLNINSSMKGYIKMIVIHLIR